MNHPVATLPWGLSTIYLFPALISGVFSMVNPRMKPSPISQQRGGIKHPSQLQALLLGFPHQGLLILFMGWGSMVRTSISCYISPTTMLAQASGTAFPSGSWTFAPNLSGLSPWTLTWKLPWEICVYARQRAKPMKRSNRAQTGFKPGENGDLWKCNQLVLRGCKCNQWTVRDYIYI